MSNISRFPTCFLMAASLLISSGCHADPAGDRSQRHPEEEQLENFRKKLLDLGSALDEDREYKEKHEFYSSYLEDIEEVGGAYYKLLPSDRIQEIQGLINIDEARKILKDLIGAGESGDPQKFEEAQDKLKSFAESDDLRSDGEDGQDTLDAVEEFLEFKVVDRLQILLAGLESGLLDFPSQSVPLIGWPIPLDIGSLNILSIILILSLLIAAIEMRLTMGNKYSRDTEQPLKPQLINDIQKILGEVCKLEGASRRVEKTSSEIRERMDIKLMPLKDLDTVLKRVEEVLNLLNRSKPSSDEPNESDKVNALVNSFNQGIESFNNKRISLDFRCRTVSVSSESIDEIRRASGRRVRDMILRRCPENRCDFLIVERENSSYLFLTRTNIRSTLDEAIPSLFDGFQQQTNSRNYDLCQPARVSKINEENWRLNERGKIQLRTS